jgi:hypothetical protein
MFMQPGYNLKQLEESCCGHMQLLLKPDYFHVHSTPTWTEFPVDVHHMCTPRCVTHHEFPGRRSLQPLQADLLRSEAL